MLQRDEDLTFEPAKFSGRVRLFPLPNLVLFPHVIQPLRVFEPRYVDLLHDALQNDRLIAMALLSSGWEQDYEGRPPISPVACLGRVLTWQSCGSAASSDGGRQYNLLLVGLRRVRLLAELPPERSFREAEVEVLEDIYPESATPERPALQRKLVSAFEALLPCIEDASELFNQVSAKNLTLGALTDVIGYALDMGVRAKQALLNELDVDRRARMLIEHLDGATLEAAHEVVAASFPPAFSTN